MYLNTNAYLYTQINKTLGVFTENEAFQMKRYTLETLVRSTKKAHSE